MGPISIRIGHNNDFIVIDIFKLKIGTDPSTNRMDNRRNFFIFHNVFELGFFRVNDFTP